MDDVVIRSKLDVEQSKRSLADRDGSTLGLNLLPKICPMWHSRVQYSMGEISGKKSDIDRHDYNFF